jgi:site-specific DNA recombinase
VQRWNLPDGWVISTRPAHPALVSEADFIAVQEISAPRGPAGTATRRYLLAGLIRCGTCGRRLESSWSNGHPAYRCRHGYTSATRPDSTRARNSYIREDQILPHLAALSILLASHGYVPRRPGQAGQIASPAQAAALIDHLRPSGRALTYDPQKRTLQADTEDAVTVAVG